jgi:hypothetical protein
MSKLKYNVKFPCGYEISMELKSSFYGYASGEFDEDKLKSVLYMKKLPT